MDHTSFRHCSCTNMLHMSPSHCIYSAGPTVVVASPPPKAASDPIRGKGDADADADFNATPSCA